MGGIGSGRTDGFGGSAAKCHEYLSIDLAWLRRKKHLEADRPSTITWSWGERELGLVTLQAVEGGVRLFYRQRWAGDDWTEVNEIIPLVVSRTQFGGWRQWFLCLTCGGRCRVVYGGAYFRCRRCYRLQYESQYSANYARACDQAHKLRKRLGQVGSLDDPFPSKPKGMHWKTYQRLVQRDAEARQRWASEIAQKWNLLAMGE